MIEDFTRSQTARTSINFPLLSIVMLLLALVLPFAYHIDVGPGPDSIRAMSWEYIEASWYTGFRFWDPLDTLPYTILRLAFAVMIARTLAGKSTSRRAMLVGLLSELQPVAVSAPLTYLIDWPGDPQVPLYIPIPIFFIIGGIIIFFIRKSRTKPEENLVPATDEETEIGMKVVAIMQTITEELDDSDRRLWSKMLGTSEKVHRHRDFESEKHSD